VQTLKTAIVVLLMMTVIYGCYVSLTTSPEPLPEHIVNLIDESGSFDDLGIDEGLPGSFADFGSESDDPSADDAEMGPTQLSFSDSANAIPASTDVRSGTPAAMASFSDREASGRQLPKPGDGTSGVTTDLNADYPSTQVAAASLPDPRSIDSLPPSGWKPDTKPSGADLSTPGQTKTPASESSDANVGLANAIRTADRQYAADQPAEALATLSLFYNTPGLTDAERTAMLNRLDPLAATVIYSKRHLLEQPHRVGQAETLMEIASRYELPWQLLANINSIEDPVTVLPGTELKVVRGPFRAEVNLQRNELTIFLGDLYAGRFPIAVGTTPAPEEGTYTVQDKQSAQTFYDKDGTPIPPDDPRNPYGNVWLDLGKQLCIHGSPDKSQPSTEGCISLRGGDADDLYGILSQGSTVTIRR
jgi:lipoprotein-anchoring transpeptidase ErfK/SrfK